MAAGDVILQITNMPVTGDESRVVGSPPNQSAEQETVLVMGTTLTPSGVTVVPIQLTVRRALVGGDLPETLFDSAKRYKLTIEEV